ncbi:rhomboid family intramembrane serine protease [Streptomyces agglomeratus]|uniref:Rhomboid family intramembrane serine protease n=1 Tax=Streptomyces agglomeratus TaxID=285458 RepID=A0A1E5PJU2_9ACTN|nr:rhomboid family intramembrane serine protease [Streptomyces agglomeratus]OEJ29705.1 rhomboid family intramembrane serine protease [Streptomyces agglomeratus]OEJ42279.1 rhomboid family intramembrane serine protease [Streptomyces agglomeratus]OEJ49214.1 rhomboid family intramembrane serine protease [Streptomyces agglomeratus]OEJ55592.1 rhomboid family intramembrane serine protease [Streptomyces agglomeratus]OEJ62974.1 rhomboid family intramembrane serine protease [Streptomyces agglomeratus]
MEAAVTTCYRHPKYETYVSCTRCERFICPDCMREAAVGHQCPECVKEGHKSVRRARTVFGGSVAGTAAPVVTYTLIALNVLAYLGELARPDLVDRFGMLGWGLLGPEGGVYPHPTLVGVAEDEWYRLLTGAFLHLPVTGGSFGIMHIIMNMFCLWNVGRTVEDQLGRARYAGLYLLSALGGSVLVYLLTPHTVVVGASGAIFGISASYYVICRRLGRDMQAVNRFLAGLMIWMVLSALFTSWQAHLGGLLTGGLVSLALAYAPPKHRTVVQVAAGAGVLVLLIALVLMKTSALTSFAG